jgi:nitroreductase
MIIKEILNRRAVREYRSDDVSDEQVLEIIKAGQFAPSAHNNQAVEFVVVRDQATKDKILDVVGQEFVKEAPVLIVPATDTTKSSLPIQDLSVASENMLLQATALGLGTVWKNLQPEWAEQIKKLLNIPEQYTIINLIPVGRPQGEVAPHTDTDFNSGKIHENSW